MRQIGLVLKRADEEALVLARAICLFVTGSGRRALVEPTLADYAEILAHGRELQHQR